VLLLHGGKLVFAKLTEHLPQITYRPDLALHAAEHELKNYTCREQFICSTIAQLAYRESVHDIEACLPSAAPQALSHGYSQLNLAMFEHTPLDSLLSTIYFMARDDSDFANELNLFI
jgi:hypothetical protein